MYYFNKPWKGPVPKTKAQKENAAVAAVRYNDKGCAFVPWQQIKGCIKQAMSLAKMKVERSNKRAIELCQAAVWVKPEELVIEPKRKNGDVEIVLHDLMTDQGKLIESGFARINPDWKLVFDLEIALLEPDFIKEALEFGGQFCGIGGRRQDKNGRFEITAWNPL